MKEKLVGCLAAGASVVIFGLLVNLMMGGLFSLGRAAVQMGLMVI